MVALLGLLNAWGRGGKLAGAALSALCVRRTSTGRPGRRVQQAKPAAQVEIGPSSSARSMFAIGLYTNEVPAKVPAHRIPRRWASLPEVIAKTADPLSPAPTPAVTKFWHRSALRDPRTRTSTHVSVT